MIICDKNNANIWYKKRFLVDVSLCNCSYWLHERIKKTFISSILLHVGKHRSHDTCSYLQTPVLPKR